MENIIFNFHDTNFERWKNFIKASAFREEPKREKRTIRYSDHLNGDCGSVTESKNFSTEELD